MTKTIYIIANRCGTESYDFYTPHAFYLSRQTARKHWKQAVKDFLMMGPDDIQNLQFTECTVTDKQCEELKEHFKKCCQKDSEHQYNRDFVSFMEDIISKGKCITSMNCDGNYDIFRLVQEANPNVEWEDVFGDEKVYLKYLDKYLKTV